jgi:hypothetical protein
VNKDYLKPDFLEQLKQLTTITWDGELISKSNTNYLHKHGLITRTAGGWNIINKKGIQSLIEIGALRS